MGMTIWESEVPEKTIDLGDPFLVYQSLAEISKVAGLGYNELQSLPDYAEQDIDEEWLEKVKEQAKEILDKFGENLSDHSNWLLRQLIEK